MKYSLFFILLLASCSQAQHISTQKVKIHPSLTLQNYEHFKRLILTSPNSDLEYIRDFDFKWGYHYELLIEEERLEEPLSDGTRSHYRLKRQISQTPASRDSTFQLFIDPDRYYYHDSTMTVENQTLEQLNDSTYRYFEQVEIEVPIEFRADFLSIMENRGKRRGSFRFVGNERIRLVGLD